VQIEILRVGLTVGHNDIFSLNGLPGLRFLFLGIGVGISILLGK